MSSKPYLAADRIRRQILNGDYNVDERLPAERELASAFACSQFTISRALSLLADEGLIEKRRGSGSYIKTTKQTIEVAYLTSAMHHTVNPIWTSVFDALNILSDRPHIHYNLFVTEQNTSPIPARRLHASDIIVSARDGDEVYIDNVLGLEKPVIWLNDFGRKLPGASITFDNYRAGAFAGRHLYEAGCRNLVYVQYDFASRQNQSRFDGFRQALQEQDEFVNLLTYTWFGEEDEARQRLTSLLRSENGIDGVFCFADRLAARVVQAALDGGRQVPSNLKVMGVDDSELSQHFIPPLTSIHQNADAFAEQIITVIRAFRAGEMPSGQFRVSPLLMPRRSTEN